MKTVISVKVDKDVKDQAQEVAASIGISMSTLISAYLRQVSATRHVDLYAPEPITPKLKSLIAQIEKEIGGGEVSDGFTSAEEFLADLKK